ncbi:MAG: hypothetical protein IJT30_12015 [Muribaculaceae bacterium]|nr:hypothetical protein [Muribaculaceae bacterium]
MAKNSGITRRKLPSSTGAGSWGSNFSRCESTLNRLDVVPGKATEARTDSAIKNSAFHVMKSWFFMAEGFSRELSVQPRRELNSTSLAVLDSPSETSLLVYVILAFSVVGVQDGVD